MAALALVACEPATTAPEANVVSEAEAALPTELTEAAQATYDRVLEAAESGSQRQLARLADEFPGFQSNFGGGKHFDYWYMRRRMGADPNVALVELLAEPYGVKRVGGEVWYIWPDLAAIDVRDFDIERLRFKDRARLVDLIGEDGIAAMTRGQAYPGFRTAITTDGRWVYYLDGD